MGDQVEAGHSREEGTLVWQLMQARSEMASMLHPPLPPSAVLHPLYTAKLRRPGVDRASFAHHIQQIKASLRTFVDEAISASTLPQLYESDEAKSDAKSDSKAKKDRMTSLLRENASHSTAVTAAARQLQRTADWSTLLSSRIHTPRSEKVNEPPIQAARKQIQHFVQTCETMAKDLKMEAFADEHVGITEASPMHTHTLTLAASIIVVDVEVCLEQQSEYHWIPLVKIRLSYATDSTTSKPIQRDQSLAECLRIDLQAVADLSMGWEQGTDENQEAQDCVSALILHQARAKRTLETLKRIDDLSTASSSNLKDSGCPDLFAALDDVGRQMQAKSRDSVTLAELLSVGGGLPLQHIGSPYTSIVYHINADLASAADVARELDRRTLSPSGKKARLHFITINIAQSSTKVLASSSCTSTLPKIDAGDAGGSSLLYTAVLQPPVLMSKRSAQILCLKAGIVLGQDVRKPTKKASSEPSKLASMVAASYEEILSSLGRHPPEEEEETAHQLQFVSQHDFGRDTKSQGVLISQFPFASLQHLNDAIAVLRQQVQLNSILQGISQSTSNTTEGEEITLKDILSDSEDGVDPPTSQVSLVADIGSDGYTVFINVPLRRDIWTLEVRLWTREGRWSIAATVGQIGQEHGKQPLEKDSSLYKESIALLDREGSLGLRQALSNLRSWSLELVDEAVSKTSSTTAPTSKEAFEKADADRLGPLPGEQSPSHDIRESRTKGRRGSVLESSSATGSTETSKGGVMTRRRSNAQSPVNEKESGRSTSATAKRRASQAGLEDDDGQKRASRKRT